MYNSTSSSRALLLKLRKWMSLIKITVLAQVSIYRSLVWQLFCCNLISNQDWIKARQLNLQNVLLACLQKCVQLKRAKSTTGTGISVWISCLVANSKERAVAPGLLSVVESCGPWWCPSWQCMAWYGILWYGMVWCGMVWFGTAWYVEACEQVRTMPASRNPLEGNLHRAASPVCRCCRALLCCTCSCPYCSLSRRHSPGWSNFSLLLLFNLFYQFVFLLDWCRHHAKTSHINSAS